MSFVPHGFWRKPQPVIGVLLVVAGWAIAHQAGSNAVFDDCTRRGGGFVVLVSFAGLVVTAFGGAYGLLAARASVGPGRRFFGVLAALLGLLAGFATLLQIVAGLILPPCAA